MLVSSIGKLLLILMQFMFVRQSNPDISNFMKKWNMTNDYHKLESIYIKKLLDIVSSYPTNNGRGGLNDPQLPKT